MKTIRTDFVVFESANAIKFTIRRLRPSGGLGESDLFGSQQYASLRRRELLSDSTPFATSIA